MQPFTLATILPSLTTGDYNNSIFTELGISDRQELDSYVNQFTYVDPTTRQEKILLCDDPEWLIFSCPDLNAIIKHPLGYTINTRLSPNKISSAQLTITQIWEAFKKAKTFESAINYLRVDKEILNQQLLQIISITLFELYQISQQIMTPSSLYKRFGQTFCVQTIDQILNKLLKEQPENLIRLKRREPAPDEIDAADIDVPNMRLMVKTESNNNNNMEISGEFDWQQIVVKSEPRIHNQNQPKRQKNVVQSSENVSLLDQHEAIQVKQEPTAVKREHNNPQFIEILDDENAASIVANNIPLKTIIKTAASPSIQIKSEPLVIKQQQSQRQIIEILDDEDEALSSLNSLQMPTEIIEPIATVEVEETPVINVLEQTDTVYWPTLDEIVEVMKAKRTDQEISCVFGWTPQQAKEIPIACLVNQFTYFDPNTSITQIILTKEIIDDFKKSLVYFLIHVKHSNGLGIHASIKPRHVDVKSLKLFDVWHASQMTKQIYTACNYLGVESWALNQQLGFIFGQDQASVYNDLQACKDENQFYARYGKENGEKSLGQLETEVAKKIALQSATDGKTITLAAIHEICLVNRDASTEELDAHLAKLGDKETIERCVNQFLYTDPLTKIKQILTLDILKTLSKQEAEEYSVNKYAGYDQVIDTRLLDETTAYSVEEIWKALQLSPRIDECVNHLRLSASLLGEKLKKLFKCDLSEFKAIPDHEKLVEIVGQKKYLNRSLQYISKNSKLIKEPKNSQKVRVRKNRSEQEYFEKNNQMTLGLIIKHRKEKMSYQKIAEDIFKIGRKQIQILINQFLFAKENGHREILTAKIIDNFIQNEQDLIKCLKHPEGSNAKGSILDFPLSLQRQNVDFLCLEDIIEVYEFASSAREALNYLCVNDIPLNVRLKSFFNTNYIDLFKIKSLDGLHKIYDKSRCKKSFAELAGHNSKPINIEDDSTDESQLTASAYTFNTLDGLAVTNNNAPVVSIVTDARSQQDVEITHNNAFSNQL